MIRTGNMVKFLPGFAAVRSKRYNGIFTVLKIEAPPADATDRMALILHPTGETSWEFFSNLIPIS